MNKFFSGSLLLAALLLGSAKGQTQTTTSTAKQPAPQEKGTTETTPPPRRIVYKAAAASAPATRLTGGSRGEGDASVRLDVLAPNEVGLTTQESPSLFWFQSKPAKASFELTLLEDEKPKPVLQVKNERATESGIQRVKLADHGVKLQPGVEYRWVVALVMDPANRSKDLVASGFVKRVEPSAELREKLSHATPEQKAGIYAAEGIWHDALGSLSDQIEAQPQRTDLVAERADLLKQVGLKIAPDPAAKTAKR